MTENPKTLFPATEATPPGHARHGAGILPGQGLRELIRGGQIAADTEFTEKQIQPASLDLRLGEIAYRVRASFLPGREATVAQKIERFGMHEIDLNSGAVLEKGCVYIVPLIESLDLRKGFSGVANPKSSIGRIDVFTRLITDRATEFDRVAPGYSGPLYAEISPCAFTVLVRKGSRLNQLRLHRGSAVSRASSLRKLHKEVGLTDAGLGAENIAGGKLSFTVDLKGDHASRPIGYRARRHAGLIDIDQVGYYDPLDYWEPILARDKWGLVLDPNDFYILASREAVTVPPDHAAEMVAFDALVGEFRAHYAGFFDPGFGYRAEGGDRRSSGTRAVLEVRSHQIPFVLEHGQIVGRLAYERLTKTPEQIYGGAIGSSYHDQGLALSKHFKPVEWR
jgi:dCTP deaminase